MSDNALIVIAAAQLWSAQLWSIEGRRHPA